MYKILLASLIIFFLLTGCTHKSDYVLLQTNQNTTQQKLALKQSYEYIIMPQDRLLVTLYRNPELANDDYTNNSLAQSMQKNGILVNAKGYVTLPLVNKIKVAGLTQDEAAKKITERYKKFLKIPTVYVEVLNKRVYVVGEVNKPGPVKLDREKTTVLEAIAEAGDLTDSAVRDNIIVLSRNAQHRLYMRSVDLTHFDPQDFSNMILKPNDIVYVQPDGWKEFKVNSSNFTKPFKTITDLVSPFVTLKYLRIY